MAGDIILAIMGYKEGQGDGELLLALYRNFKDFQRSKEE